MSQLPSFDRSAKNGFRCVKYIDKEKIPESAFQTIKFKGSDYSKEKPVRKIFLRYIRTNFCMTKQILNANIEAKDESSKDWIIEKITFNAAYGNERI